jgi:hypothetical protein
VCSRVLEGGHRLCGSELSGGVFSQNKILLVDMDAASYSTRVNSRASNGNAVSHNLWVHRQTDLVGKQDWVILINIKYTLLCNIASRDQRQNTSNRPITASRAGLPYKVHFALRALTTFPQWMRLNPPFQKADSLVRLATWRQCCLRWIVPRLAWFLRNSEWES